MLVSVEDYASLHPPQAALRLRPPEPQSAMEAGWATKQLPRVLFTSPGKFLGKRKRKNGRWRKLAFSSTYFFVFHGAPCASQASASAGRPGTVVSVKASCRYPQLLRRQSCLFWFFSGLQKRTPRPRTFYSRIFYGNKHPIFPAALLLFLKKAYNISFKYRRSASCQSGKGIKPASANLLLSRRLFAGRAAFERPYSAVETGSTRVFRPAWR